MNVELSNGGYAIIDEEDWIKVKNYTWRRLDANTTSYAITKINGDTVYMHRLIGRIPDNLVTDHINGNGLDNRKENLRACTQAQNLRSNGPYRESTCPEYRGVRDTKRSLSKPYQARIKKDGKQRHIGYFSDPREAAEAYDEKARELFGEYAYQNFPRET